MKKVIELIRVSTESQAADDRASIPAQRTVNRRTASSYGLEIIRSIEMTDVSGATVLYAPEMRELLTLIQSPEIHGVVAREFSRLMRPENYGDFAILQAFAESNTILYLPDGPIDFSSKTGRLLGTIRAAIAGMERTEILERIWTSKEEKRRQGKFAQSKACLPTGVDYTEEKGFFYNDDAWKIKEAFRLFLSGVTSYSELEKKVGLSQYALRKMLRNTIYTGWRVIDHKRDMSAGGKRPGKNGRQSDRRKIKRAEDEIIRVKVIDEPLVNERDFNQVQAMMDAKRVNHWKANPSCEHKFTYNGFLFCAECGSLIYTRHFRDLYYICKNKQTKHKTGCKARYMRQDVIEPSLDEMFTKKLTDHKFLMKIADAINKGNESTNAEMLIDKLTSQRATLKSKRNRIIDSFIEGVISAQERDNRLKTIDVEICLVNENLLRQNRVEISPKLLTDTFSVFYEFEFLTREEKRKLLSAIAPRIRIKDYFLEKMDVMIPHFDTSIAAMSESTRTRVHCRHKNNRRGKCK